MGSQESLCRGTVSSSWPVQGIMVLTLLAVLSRSAAAFDDPTGGGDREFPRMSLDQDPKPAAPPAKEEEPKKPWRSFELMFGGVYSSVTSSVLVNRTDHSSTLNIDAEGVLGMSHEVLSPYVWTAIRLGERHRILFSFEDLSRTASRTLTKDIEINGTTYPLGTSIHSEFGLQMYNLSYAWSFLQDERMELGLTFSFDVLRTHIAVDVQTPPRTTNERFILPIPLPGFDADFVLIKDLWLRQRLELMYVPIQNYAGFLIDFNMSLEYSFIKDLSIGLGFDIQRLGVESNSNNTTWGSFDGKFKLDTAGVMFYINFHL